MVEQNENDPEFLLCQYLDGQLGRRERLSLEKRLGDDPALREMLRQYASLDGCLADLAEQGPDGVDYDLQRTEIIAAVEKRTLLVPARRRPIFFRPVFALSAAAAMVLVAVSVWLVVLNLGSPPETGGVVSVKVLPVGPRTSGTGQVVVQVCRPGDDEPILAPPVAAGAAATPAGTIVVSFGPDTSPRPTLVDNMMVY